MGRRSAAAALVVAAAAAVTLAHDQPASAAWSGTGTRATTVSMASLGTAFTKVRGDGTATTSGYSINGVLNDRVGYVTLTNTSSVPAVVTMSFRMAALVAGTTVQQCSVAWSADDTCAGTTTTLADSQVLGAPSGTCTWPASVPAGADINLRARTVGVGAGVSLSATATPARAAGDRTTS